MYQPSFINILEHHPLRKVKKGEVLVESGRKSNEAYYVVKGCLRSYLTDDKGKEHIYQFAPEDWIISDLEFQKTRGNAFLTIDAIEDSEVRVIKIESFVLDVINDQNRETVETALTKFQNRIYSLQKRVIQLLAYPAEARYEEFIKTYPNLVNRIPLKMISSYLGITPESLSRVRKEMAKGK